MKNRTIKPQKTVNIIGIGTAGKNILNKFSYNNEKQQLNLFFIDSNESENDIENILNEIKESEYLILLSCLGGNSGTNTTPIIAKLSKDIGLNTIAIVTTPFSFEGRQKLNQALEALEKLNKYTRVHVFNNDIFLYTLKKRTTLKTAFEMIDKNILNTISAVIEENFM